MPWLADAVRASGRWVRRRAVPTLGWLLLLAGVVYLIGGWLRADDVPDRQALVESGGRTLTWAGVEDEVARLATGLGAHGIRAGQRVMIAVGNRIEFVTSYLGVLRAQVVAVPVNPRSTPGELARMIADSGSRMVVADETALDAVTNHLVLEIEQVLEGDVEEVAAAAGGVEVAVRLQLVAEGA